MNKHVDEAAQSQSRDEKPQDQEALSGVRDHGVNVTVHKIDTVVICRPEDVGEETLRRLLDRSLRD